MNKTLLLVILAIIFALAAGAVVAAWLRKDTQIAPVTQPAALAHTAPAPETPKVVEKPPIQLPTPEVVVVTPPPAPEVVAAPAAPPPQITPSPAPPVAQKPAAPKKQKSQKNAPQDPNAPPPPEPIIPVKVARDALFVVGTGDPEAEQIWAQSINDPNLSDKVREDLIEDLNEHGFPDPKNLTQEDLPLIESRILLIERYGPEAMDENNYKSFREAYKDLINMWLKLNR